MTKEYENEILERIDILRNLGFNDDFCKKMEAGFALAGFAVEPDLEYEYMVKLKDKVENEYGKVLFGLLDTVYDFQCLSFVFVSQFFDDWWEEKEELKNGIATAMVFNISEDLYEMGQIEFSLYNGYPVRVK